MYDWNRATPVALSGEEPVAQAVADSGAAAPPLAEPGNDPLFPLRCRQVGELRGVDELRVDGLRDVRQLGLAAVGWGDDLSHGHVVLAREFEVAVVVPGDRHDRP